MESHLNYEWNDPDENQPIEVCVPEMDIGDDMLIQAYIPDAEYLSHDDAMKLALERDEQAAMELENSVKDANQKRIDQILYELGY